MRYNKQGKNTNVANNLEQKKYVAKIKSDKYLFKTYA